ncbi:hypothetical protein D3C71_1316410 [compost metagenome]
MAAPHGRQLEAHGQGAVGVLGHIAEGEVIPGKAAGEQQQGGPEQGGIEQRQRFGAAQQGRGGEVQAQPGQGALQQGERRCQQQ